MRALFKQLLKRFSYGGKTSPIPSNYATKSRKFSQLTFAFVEVPLIFLQNVVSLHFSRCFIRLFPYYLTGIRGKV